MSQSGYNTTSKNSKTRPIYLGGKQVAVLRDDRLLDIRKRSQHFVYIKDSSEGILQRSVCIATETLRQGRHANMISVTDLDSGIKYTISRRDFDKRSFDFEGSRVANLEEQRGCFLKWFSADKPEHLNYPVHVEAEPLQRKSAASPKEKQLVLNGWMK